jgi:hypothetical protein
MKKKPILDEVVFILFLSYILVHEVLNFLKNDGKMFKYYNRLDGVLMLKKQSLP